MKEEYKYFIQGPASLVLKVEEEFGAAEIAITLDHEGIDASPFYFDDHNVKNQAKLSYFIEDAVEVFIKLSSIALSSSSIPQLNAAINIPYSPDT